MDAKLLVNRLFWVRCCNSEHTRLRQCLMTVLGGLAKRGPLSCMVRRALCELPDSSENEDYPFSVGNLLYTNNCEACWCGKESKTSRLDYRRGQSHANLQARAFSQSAFAVTVWLILRGNLDLYNYD